MLIRFNKNSEYHFTTFSSYNKEHVLTTTGAPEIIIENLRKLRDDNKLLVYGFVIMPNHVHLIWHIPLEPGISKIMQLLKGRTSKEILHLLRLTGNFDVKKLTRPDKRLALWKPRYYNFNLTSEDKFLEKLEYTHNNPVKWGLVSNPAEWPYSSFRSWYDLPEVLFEVDKE